MNIYDEDLKLDPDKATAEVRATIGQNDAAAKRALVTIQTAALIDIADSLRTLAIEAAISMNGRGVFATLDDADERETESFAVLTAEAGQPVRFLRDYDGSYPIGRLTGDTGVSEGEAWAGVRWSEDDEPVRVWAKDLELVGSVTTPDGVEHVGEIPAESIELLADVTTAYEDPEPEPTVASDPDDLDSDFDGDRHPAADDALAALKAREKAAKSKKGKK